MSDIEFLSIKEFGNKLFEDDGSSGVVGSLASLTASGGKDLYLAEARVQGTNITGGAQIRFADIELRINGVSQETVRLQINDPGSTAGYKFALKGVKVLAGQTINLEITSISELVLTGVITGFEEDTGASPQI